MQSIELCIESEFQVVNLIKKTFGYKYRNGVINYNYM